MPYALVAMTRKKPNILFIMADNHPAALLGCYGNPEIHTPNLDKLASESVKFKQAYCVNAMCSPCRASVLTGLMPSQHGVHTWIDDRNMQAWPDKWNALADTETLPEILKDNGYQTALIGKYHLGSPFKAQNGFDHWVTFPHGHTRDFYGNTFIENESKNVYEGHSVDGFTEKAVQYLNQLNQEKPFFMFLSYNGPYGHWPAIKGKRRHRFANLYDDCPMNSVPREGLSKEAIQRYLMRQEKSGGGLDYSAVLRIPNDLESLRNYYSEMTLVDDCIGQILTTLDQQNLTKDTLIIYTTDHGFSLGHHGFWGHGQATWPSNTHKEAFHISLLIKHKGKLQARENDDLISQLDLFPTLLEYVGIQANRDLPAINFKDTLLDKNLTSKREAVFMEQEETRSIRTKDWLYMKRFKDSASYPLEDELYNIATDPKERNNLIGDSKYKNTLSQLDAHLESYFSSYSTPKFDLWNGGTAKSNSDKTFFWKDSWGTRWSPTFG